MTRALTALVLAAAACSTGSAPAACPGEIAAVTYNVRRGKPTDGVHNWEYRRGQVIALLGDLAADLIGLQEPLAHQIDDLEVGLPGFAREGVGRDDGARAGEYAAIFYRRDRFERAEGGTVWLSPTPGRPRGPDEAKPWGTTQNRVASWALLRDRRTHLRLLAISTHFDNESEEARTESARQLVALVASHPAHQVILLGDLNAEEGSAPLAILTAALPDAAARAPTVVRSRIGTTVTSWEELKEPGRHIDHILFAGRLRPLAYEVIDRRMRYSGAERYPSDHLPVRARFCLAP